MYNLTVSYSPSRSLSIPIHRPEAPVSAPQALQDWFDAEATGYEVTCHDERGATVTKGQLRLFARQV